MAQNVVWMEENSYWKFPAFIDKVVPLKKHNNVTNSLRERILI